jgi:hypothetical protein
VKTEKSKFRRDQSIAVIPKLHFDLSLTRSFIKEDLKVTLDLGFECAEDLVQYRRKINEITFSLFRQVRVNKCRALEFTIIKLLDILDKPVRMQCFNLLDS